ncbi:hypothetical protein SCOCK_100210 [Actinacidiphila cocklensis]|uniref:Uncharacterized protein n=1 Tax=Actinacidiphila cocklensis TaxID=887465 RepID=A0A9W4DK23_9ACTN|nr:hypothetical protein SCOCK_100210 [Actinacidiphila cocklensis]
MPSQGRDLHKHAAADEVLQEVAAGPRHPVALVSAPLERPGWSRYPGHRRSDRRSLRA